jgi:uncharacterized membrane protein YkvA (DUF1232 family)
MNTGTKKLIIAGERTFSLRHDLLAAKRMFSAWHKGEYKGMSLRTIAYIVFTFAYVINPFDLIADIIPVVGWVDDLTITGILVGHLRKHINQFRAWETREL